MSIIDTVIYAILSGIIQSVFWVVFDGLILLGFTRRTIVGRVRTEAMDALLATKGYCSNRQMKIGSPPSTGIHALFGRGVIFAVRTGASLGDVSYTLYIVGKHALAAVNKAVSDDSAQVFYITGVNYQQADYKQFPLPKLQPRDWQKDALATFRKTYDNEGVVRAVISGDPGIGKSRMAELFAQMLVTFGISGIVIKGVDLTTPSAMMSHFLLHNPTKADNVILLIDEFDVAIEAASAPAPERFRQPAIADSKTSLTGALDLIENIPYLHLIVTTNRALDLPGYKEYYRDGRFNVRITVPSQTI